MIVLFGGWSSKDHSPMESFTQKVVLKHLPVLLGKTQLCLFTVQLSWKTEL